MKIKELMNRPVQTCLPSANLAEVAQQLWDTDCGAMPVVDREGQVLGMITDRDICMAAAIGNRPCADIPVSKVFSGEVFGCSPDDDTATALHTMAQHRVRRLPVIEKRRGLVGIVSLNDMCLEATKDPGTGNDRRPSYDECMEALAVICQHTQGGLAATPAAKSQKRAAKAKSGPSTASTSRKKGLSLE